MDREGSSEAGSQEQCKSCHGTGEVGSEFGMGQCPDCGGAGYLPSQHVLVEWRARDIERERAAARAATCVGCSPSFAARATP